MGKRKRPDYAARARQRLAYEERQAEARKAYARAHRPPPPSDVTVTSADGSVRVEPALTPAELRRLVKDRPPISDALRQRILRRDGHACRYCGNDTGPFEMDHVLPVTHGGITNMRNLVTACKPCNGRKGANIWKPRPLR